MRAFENCLVCGASTENTHSARKGKDALVCGGTCYRQASRNFKRNMSGYKLARIIDLLAQMGGPVTATELLNRYNDTYGTSNVMGFRNTVSVAQQLLPIVNPENIRIDKTKKPLTFEYVGGTTIGEWLKPSMRAKYESVSFKAESDSYEWEWDRTDYAPTELIKKRLKDAGFSMVGERRLSDEVAYNNQIVEFYEPQLVAQNGVVLDVCLSQNEEFEGFSRLTFYENDHPFAGETPDIDWNILHEDGLLKGEDSVDHPQPDYYQVLWDGLYDEWKNGHNCADNAYLDIYEDDFIVMECNSCGRTATFRQETPYDGPRNAETFGAETKGKPKVSVGNRVRSYDFVLPDGTLIRDDCYVEGQVTKIAPVDWCGAKCDHYHILVDKIVRNEKVLEGPFEEWRMIYPPVNESYLEVQTGSDGMEEMEAETDEYKGPFEVETRRPNGSKASWKKYENYRQLIEALEEIVSNRYRPYAIDVFATSVPYISGFTAMGPVTDYRKFHLATWKYGAWESGPWAEYLPTGLE